GEEEDVYPSAPRWSALPSPIPSLKHWRLSNVVPLTGLGSGLGVDDVFAEVGAVGLGTIEEEEVAATTTRGDDSEEHSDRSDESSEDQHHHHVHQQHEHYPPAGPTSAKTLVEIEAEVHSWLRMEELLLKPHASSRSSSPAGSTSSPTTTSSPTSLTLNTDKALPDYPMPPKRINTSDLQRQSSSTLGGAPLTPRTDLSSAITSLSRDARSASPDDGLLREVVAGLAAGDRGKYGCRYSSLSEMLLDRNPSLRSEGLESEEEGSLEEGKGPV
ncbi:hypothetical protein HK101_001528, partial [Irineochytrium annulatum]